MDLLGLLRLLLQLRDIALARFRLLLKILDLALEPLTARSEQRHEEIK